MASLTGTTVEGILGELKGRIYTTRKRTATRLPTSSSPGKCHRESRTDRAFLRENPDHARPGNRLALREATPKPIAFDDLDFNLGERWIPKGVYERFASSLFDTEVKITFAST